MAIPLSDEQRAHLAGRTVIASVSGGKDSAAMCLWLKDNEIPFRAVFLDTGWEHPFVYSFLRDTLPRFIGPVDWITPPLQMEALIEKKGMFPSRVRRFCTQDLKVFPMQNFLANLEEDHINCVGIRAAESAARAKMAEWEWSAGFDCEVWRPLLAWTEGDVLDIHRRHGLPLNPLYGKGAQRVGCWPCIFASKGELNTLAKIDPARIDRIASLESRVQEAAALRAQIRGTPLQYPPSFFQARTGRSGATWPIREIVKWAKTEHGGRQFPLFELSAEEQGCMRWGLCETGSEP